MEKISFIATVYNEQESIKGLMSSLAKQSKKPDEIIIVDAKSLDNSVFTMLNEAKKQKIDIKVIIKKTNRAQGRNEAIKRAEGDIICISDAGCILDSKWLQNITQPFLKDKKVDIVGGYYKVLGNSPFAKALASYTLVMPDKLVEKNFLPSTRSLAIKKAVWKKAGGFSENLNYSEDYAFALKLKDMGAKFVFEKKAFVYWIPRKNLWQAFKMFYHFAFNDIKAGIVRPKALLILGRYAFLIALIFLAILMQIDYLLYIIYIGIFSYILWAIFKNMKYVKSLQSLYILPTLQMLSDFAVILGTTFSIYNNLWGTRKKH